MSCSLTTCTHTADADAVDAVMAPETCDDHNVYRKLLISDTSFIRLTVSYSQSTHSSVSYIH